MINPLEFQGVIQRSQDSSILKHNENMKGVVDQSNFQSQMVKEIEHKHDQVNKKENAGKKDTKYDAKEKGNNEYFVDPNQKNKKTKKKEDEDGQVKIKKNTGFDMRI